MIHHEFTNREIEEMIERYHAANGYDAPKWRAQAKSATGLTFGQEKAVLDGLVKNGKLKFDLDELRYFGL